MPQFVRADQAVKAAIDNRAALRVHYRNNQGGQTVRVLRPLGWVNNYEFVAYCYLRNEERHFKLSNIVSYRYFDTVEEAQAYQDPSPQPVKTQPAVQTHPNSIKITPNLKSRPNPSNPNSRQPSQITAALSSDQVTTGADWSRLVQYYTACLEQENRQAYILDRQNCVPFGIESEVLSQFMQSQIAFEVARPALQESNPVSTFIEKILKASDQLLCIGYPFFVTPGRKIAPIVLSPLNVAKTDTSYRLTAEGFELSYAVFAELGVAEEEIALFTTKAESILSQNDPAVIQQLQQLMISKLCEIFNVDSLSRSDGENPGSLIDQPMLFSVKSDIFTQSLLHELKDLSEPSNWNSAPTALKQLLNSQPAHTLAAVLPQAEDLQLYVTPAYEQQARAAQAARGEPVLVVTGPPGTGKSQLVLNLIAQAFMNGESVLFASRNNQAVDVVMDRLQKEMKFQGAIRTGRSEYRLKAAQQMKHTLGQVGSGGSPTHFENLNRDYQSVREQFVQAQTQLQDIKNLEGLSLSMRQEQAEIIKRLPEAFYQELRDSIPAFYQTEWDSLQANLISLLDQVLAGKQDRLKLEKTLRQIETGDSAIIQEIAHFEDQWGAFGAGFLKMPRYDTLAGLIAHVETWVALIGFIEQLDRYQRAAAEQERAGNEWQTLKTRVSAGLHPKIAEYVQKFNEQQLSEFSAQYQKLGSAFQKLAEKRPNLLERLLVWLRLRNDAKSRFLQLKSLQQASGMPEVSFAEIQSQNLADLALVCSGISTFFKACREQHRLSAAEVRLRQEEQTLQGLREKLPPAVAGDLDKLPAFEMDIPPFKAGLAALQSGLLAHQAQMAQVIERVNAKLDRNEDRLRMLATFQNTLAGQNPLIQPLPMAVEPDAALKYLTLWREVVNFWKVCLGLAQVEKQLGQLPSEAAAVETVKAINARLLSISGEILRATWNERARTSPNEVVAKVTEYANSVEELSKDYNQTTYWQLKANAEQNLKFAVQPFPVWAVTNLSAKTNFPLQSSFFDLVIIDEASQCDIPSALPLLFRAKRIVVIGDPNQLKHVATLKLAGNQQLAAKYGISLGAYSYIANSLFDMAQRSAGTAPGTILLNEHYRSDARIIGFSNQTFYNNRLVIKTDLSLRGIRKTFLNTYGGIFWVHVAGQAQRPNTGGAYNEEEFACISKLLPFFQTFLFNAKMNGESVGVVTPYVHQEMRLKRWGADFYKSDFLTVGTAHKFQGDERDFMVFSTVLAEGSTQGSVDWLKHEKNLLNVAVTRARIGLIVVGDYNYCRALPKDHCFRQLAEYVQNEPGRLVQDYHDLLFFRKAPTPIIGTILDPHNPEHNRITLRRYLSACREFVWWSDPYFNEHILDLFWDVLTDATGDCSEIRLLTSAEQVESAYRSKSKISAEAIRRLTAEFQSHGINFEMRISPRPQLPHDRLLYTQGEAVNMPPFAGAYGDHHHVSEYTRSNTEQEFFLEYWNKAQKV